MVNILLGFLIADFLFSLILFFRNSIILNLNRNYLFFSMVIDIVLIGIIFYFKNVKGNQVKKN